MSAVFSAKDKLGCVERELGFRRTVYRKRVIDGRMSAHDRDREIALMTAIVADYRQAAATEVDPSDLFRRDQVVPANDRGAEPLGDIASRVLSDLTSVLEEEVAVSRRATTVGEGLLDRVRRLGADIHHPELHEAAE